MGPFVIACHHGNNSDLTCFSMSVEITPQLLDASSYRIETNINTSLHSI